MNSLCHGKTERDLSRVSAVFSLLVQSTWVYLGATDITVYFFGRLLSLRFTIEKCKRKKA